jgi:hypothetical protein
MSCLSKAKNKWINEMVTMQKYVALVIDFDGGVNHVYGNAPNWKQFKFQLDELGLEVIENQTSDWDGDEENIEEDCVPVAYYATDEWKEKINN